MQARKRLALLALTLIPAVAPAQRVGQPPPFDSVGVKYEFGCDHADCPSYRLLVTGAGDAVVQFDTINVRDKLSLTTLASLKAAVANVEWSLLPDSVLSMKLCYGITTHQPELTVRIYWSGHQRQVTDSHWCSELLQDVPDSLRRARDAVLLLRVVEAQLIALPVVAEAMQRHPRAGRPPAQH